MSFESRKRELARAVKYGRSIPAQLSLCPEVPAIPVNGINLCEPVRCARSACGSEHNVVCRHIHTGQLYCPRCARLINEFNNRVLIEFPSKQE